MGAKAKTLILFGATGDLAARMLLPSLYGLHRDGLLPQWAAKVHPVHRTPYITTLLTGVFVALWSLVGDAGETYNLTTGIAKLHGGGYGLGIIYAKTMFGASEGHAHEAAE